MVLTISFELDSSLVTAITNTTFLLFNSTKIILIILFNNGVVHALLVYEWLVVVHMYVLYSGTLVLTEALLPIPPIRSQLLILLTWYTIVSNFLTMIVMMTMTLMTTSDTVYLIVQQIAAVMMIRLDRTKKNFFWYFTNRNCSLDVLNSKK